MSAIPMTLSDFNDRPRASPILQRLWANRAAFAQSCAALILFAGLAVPTCCLDGSHHRGIFDGFGPICMARALSH